jgi:hypothetical protein
MEDLSMNIKLTSGMISADEAVKALANYHPLEDPKIQEGLGAFLGMHWRKPSLWRRLVYLFNPPPELIMFFDDEETSA